MQGEEALWEDYNNVAVLSQSLMLLKWMCAITEVLKGLAHCPRMRFSHNQRWGWYQAIRQQYSARLLPGASQGWRALAHVQRADSCSGLRCSPTAVCPALSGRLPVSRADGMGGMPVPQLSQLRAQGMHGEHRWRAGAAAAWAPPTRTREAPLAQMQSVMKEIP